MAEETPQENSSSEQDSSKLSSLKDKMESLRLNPKVHHASRFVSHNALEVVSGLLLLFGIIADFVSWPGGLFVASGLVLGFASEIRSGLRHARRYYMDNGPVKNAILCGLLLFFLIKATVFTASFLVLCLILVLLIQEPDDSSN